MKIETVLALTFLSIAVTFVITRYFRMSDKVKGQKSVNNDTLDFYRFNYQNIAMNGEDEKLKTEIHEFHNLINEANQDIASLSELRTRSGISKKSEIHSDMEVIRLKWRKKAGTLDE